MSGAETVPSSTTAARERDPGPQRSQQPVPGRFDRQLGVEGIGPVEQARLRACSVLVAGVGGVGGAVATYLAAAGVGRLILVHPGELEEPDLNRQTLMQPEDLGQPRVQGAVRTVRRHYPDVEVTGYDCGLDDPRLPGLIAGAGVVVDARHNFPERYWINRLCREHGVPEVVSAMDGTQVQLMTSLPGGPCWRCLFPEADAGWQPLGFRVLGAVAGTAGCLAATEAVKVITGAGTTLAGRLLFGDLWTMVFRTVAVQRRPGCPDCDPAVTMPTGADGFRPCGGMCGCAGERGHYTRGLRHTRTDGKAHTGEILTIGRFTCESGGRPT